MCAEVERDVSINCISAIVVDEAHCVEKWYVNTELTLTLISPFKVQIVHA